MAEFANLRLLLAYMFAQPGKKLLFMGIEFGQYREWSHDRSLDWNLLESSLHRGLMNWVEQLNRSIAKNLLCTGSITIPTALSGWIATTDLPASSRCCVKGTTEKIRCWSACNFTPVPRLGYLVGVPSGGYWKELLNSDARDYGGSGPGNMGGTEAFPEETHGRPYSLRLTLPPLGALLKKA